MCRHVFVHSWDAIQHTFLWRNFTKVWIQTVSDTSLRRVIGKVLGIIATLNTSLSTIITIVVVGAGHNAFLISDVSIESWVDGACCNTDPRTVVGKTTTWTFLDTGWCGIFSKIAIWTDSNTEIGCIVTEAIRCTVGYTSSSQILSPTVGWTSEHTCFCWIISISPRIGRTCCDTWLCGVISKGIPYVSQTIIWTC